MPINIIPLNGNSPLIDYEALKASFTIFLGPRCNEATMYIFNKFPAPVSSEINIDLLFIISIHDVMGNFTKHRDYFKNSIIPISVQSQLKEAKITTDDNFIIIDDFEYDATEELSSLKFGLMTFLEKRCKMTRTNIFFDPLQLIINDANFFSKNIMISSAFNSDMFFEIIKNDPYNFFKSYSPWTKDIGYTIFQNKVQEINESASESNLFGYLTKRKIERITMQLSNTSKVYSYIGQMPVSINGKAGTGKTGHLLHLLIRNLKENKNVTFLTYNHLLTKDIACQVTQIQNNLYAKWASEGLDPSHYAVTTVQTLMSFIFKLSRNCGVLHLMTRERMFNLENVLKDSMRFLLLNLPPLFQQHAAKIFSDKNDWNAAVEAIQNTKWEVHIKQYGIQFVRYLQKFGTGLTLNLEKFGDDFSRRKITMLKDMSHKNVFLKDYPGCLKNTLNALRNTESFYNSFNVKESYDLLETVMKLDVRQGDSDLKNGKISLELYKQRIKNMVKGRTTKGRILMIDEAQDCLSEEREIFYEIFQPENVVVTNGGKEQLIRFSQVCNWAMFKTNEISIKKLSSGNKSFRIKQSILDFCNFIALRHEIDLDLKYHNDVDQGHIIFDFRSSENIRHKEVFADFLKRGDVNGCSPMESLMLIDVNKKKPHANGNENSNESGNNQKGSVQTIGFVNEYGVLEDTITNEHEDFSYLNELSDLTQYWNGTGDNKVSLGFPHPNEVRIINYESCRGLEAWCVVCFNIDTFYYALTKSAAAEKYLLHEGIVLSSQVRAGMYAITMVLMAATRAIDTLYLQMNNTNNDFYKLSVEYSKLNSAKCSVYS